MSISSLNIEKIFVVYNNYILCTEEAMEPMEVTEDMEEAMVVMDPPMDFLEETLDLTDQTL